MLAPDIQAILDKMPPSPHGEFVPIPVEIIDEINDLLRPDMERIFRETRTMLALSEIESQFIILNT